METILTNAHVVTAEEAFVGTVVITDSQITDIVHGASQAAGAEDLDGDYLLPGLIDLHTDALEKQMMPRPHVAWNSTAAAIAHDALTTTAGITTVFEALTAGTNMAHPERNETLKPMIEGLHKTQENGMLRGEHLVHLRCEITDPMVMELFQQVIDHPLIRFLSVNDHTPGRRQYPDMDYYRKKHMRNYGLDDEEMDKRVDEILEQSRKYGPQRRAEVVEIGRAKGIPQASHDDRTIEEIEQAAEEGVVMAEFPLTIVAADTAREHGLQVLAGAPNLVRGGSHHPGNPLTGDLANRRVLDILASDYIPFSLILGIFKLTEAEFGFSLPDAVKTGSINPAKAAGFTDRGEIAVGKRADVVQVRVVDEIPLVRRVWVRGQLVV